MSEQDVPSIADALAEAWNEATTDTETVEAEPTEEISEPQEEVAVTDGEDTPVPNEVVAEAEEATEELEPETAFQAPEHWSSDYKTRFDALEEAARELVLDFDADFKRGYQERVQDITDIQQALEPWKDMVAQLGVSEAQAIRTLFAAYNQLLTNPVQGVQSLAQSFGVMDQLTAPDTDDDFVDPEIKALRNEVQSLRQGVTNFTQQATQQQYDDVQAQIDSFKAEANEDGSLKHPHFDTLAPTIATLIRAGKTMEEAYQEAVWMIPEYRKAQQPKQPTAQEKAAKVAKAKKAAASIKPASKEAPSSDDKPLSVADELRAAWNEAS